MIRVQGHRVNDFESCVNPGDFHWRKGKDTPSLWFRCPCGCGVRIRLDLTVWKWNGDEDRPTITPSIDIMHCHWHGHLTCGVFIQK